MKVMSRTVTAGELLQMPEDGLRYELVKGELRTITPAGSKHGNIGMKLGAALALHVEAYNLGEVFNSDTGFLLSASPDTVRAPDIAFVSKDRIPEGDLTETFWPGAPDLAVEVVSSKDTLYELEEKIEEYLKNGIRVVWIINPKKRTVTIHRPQNQPQTLTEGETLEGQEVVPGFRFNLAKLFSRKPR